MSARDAFEWLAAGGTSAVSDALDVHGASGTVWGTRRLSGSGVVVGAAFTVAFEPAAPGQAAPAADYIDEVPPGAVVVMANAGLPRCTVWGDILTQVALSRGIAGTVIHGHCRDLDGIRRLDYPLWAKGAFMRSGKSRVRLAATEVPVVLGEDNDVVTIRPGDIVCADGSGVVAVPASLLDAVADTVAEIVSMEERVLADVGRGVSLRDARATHGYNRFAREQPRVTRGPQARRGDDDLSTGSRVKLAG